jgi:hypothetical protein
VLPRFFGSLLFSLEVHFLRHLLIRIRRIQQLSAQLSATVDDRRDIQRTAEHLLEEATILVESFYGEGVRRPAPLVRGKFGIDGNYPSNKPE